MNNITASKKIHSIEDARNLARKRMPRLMFRSESNFKSNEEVDTPGTKIAVFERSAYDLWLTDNLKNAELVRASSIEESHNLFRNSFPPSSLKASSSEK